jgi:glucokinase
MTLLYAYDPEIIVLGGSVSNAYPFYEARMREKLKSFNYQNSLARLVITQSKKANIAVLGAAALCLDAR